MRDNVPDGALRADNSQLELQVVKNLEKRWKQRGIAGTWQVGNAFGTAFDKH